MTIATWNINGMQARLAFLQHWLRARQPDLVMLQELKQTGEHFPHDELGEIGYRAVVHGQKSWNGVAILTHAERVGEARAVCRGLPGLEQHGARLVGAEVQVDGVGPLSCTSVYVPNGRTVTHPEFTHKLAFLDGLVQYARAALAGPAAVLIGGDLNLCPGPLDTCHEDAAEGRIFHTAAERERFAALLDMGLVDLFRQCNPGVRQYSWWDYRAGSFHKNQGLRIDFLLAGAALAGGTAAVRVDRDYRKKQEGMIASDHAPVIADLAPVVAELAAVVADPAP